MGSAPFLDIKIRFGFLALGSAMLSQCLPAGGKNLNRSGNGSVNSKDKASLAGLYPQLGSPAPGLVQLCNNSALGNPGGSATQPGTNTLNCSQLPWSVEQYNQVAAMADTQGELCSVLYVPQEKNGVKLLNTPQANGTPVVALTPGTPLAVVSDLGNGKAEFPEVIYADSLGKTYGGPQAEGQRVYAVRSELTCLLPAKGTAEAISELENSPLEKIKIEKQRPQSSSAGPLTGEQKTLDLPPIAGKSHGESATMRCKVNVPWFRKWTWEQPICYRDIGLQIDLKRDDEVLIRAAPEPGTPVMYYEVNQKCKIKEENIDLPACLR